MLRKFFILIILILIISTTFIKNHTKKIDEKIFFTKENIIYLNSILGLVQLEHNYLSSPAKLQEHKEIFFQDELKYTPKKNIIIVNDRNKIIFNNLNKKDE
tara:strand:- start:592 stop:894 length:303 start_codon:yes stop_codon:yes gene_type:complete